MPCLFCQIINKELPSSIVYEDKEIIGFKNIHPEAPIHLLFTPKRHIEWEDEISEEGSAIFTKLIMVARKVAVEQNIFKAAKLVFNIGKTGHISHIHLHLLGGWSERIPMKNVSEN